MMKALQLPSVTLMGTSGIVIVGAVTGAVAGTAALITYGLLTSKGGSALLAGKMLGSSAASTTGTSTTAATLAGTATGTTATTAGTTAATGLSQPKWLQLLMPAAAGAAGGGGSSIGIARKLQQQMQEKIQQVAAMAEAQANELGQRLQSMEDQVDSVISAIVPAAETESDLEEIKGIGPKFAGLLREAGIHTIADLSRSTPEIIHSILVNHAAKQMIKPDDWISQAKQLLENSKQD